MELQPISGPENLIIATLGIVAVILGSFLLFRRSHSSGRGPMRKIRAKITSIITGSIVLAIGCVLIIAPLYSVESAGEDQGIGVAGNTTGGLTTEGPTADEPTADEPTADDPTAEETITALKADNLTLAAEREAMTAKISELDEQVTVLVNHARRLEARIDKVTISGFYKFSVGEFDHQTSVRPRHPCVHDVDAEAQSLCGNETAVRFLFDERAGDRCGYADYVVACMRD
jgi:hypothetical protein